LPTESATITYMGIVLNSTVSVIRDAAKSLISGNLVAFPTETVYGLGADATNKDAISRMYRIKGRPTDHPLIVHISSIKNLDKWAREIPDYAIKLARSFWPGPMTLILPRTDLAKDFISGGQDNVGIRVPGHTVALALLKEFEAQGGLGVAAPSANKFGAVSPTTSSDVELELSGLLSTNDLILNGGPCSVGVESTILNCTLPKPIILRPGAVTKEQVENSLEYYINSNINIHDQIKSPGSFKSHYSPIAKVYLTGNPNPGDGFIAYANIKTPIGAIRLASPKNNEEYAQVLYSSLRCGDLKGIPNIYVVPPNSNGIGAAICDRLTKSSTKR
jgi:L-threonylcarbamoyladenylate synthase